MLLGYAEPTPLFQEIKANKEERDFRTSESLQSRSESCANEESQSEELDPDVTIWFMKINDDTYLCPEKHR